MLLRKKTQGAAAAPTSKIRDSLNLDEDWVITDPGILAWSLYIIPQTPSSFQYD